MDGVNRNTHRNHYQLQVLWAYTGASLPADASPVYVLGNRQGHPDDTLYKGDIHDTFRMVSSECTEKDLVGGCVFVWLCRHQWSMITPQTMQLATGKKQPHKDDYVAVKYRLKNCCRSPGTA